MLKFRASVAAVLSALAGALTAGCSAGGGSEGAPARVQAVGLQATLPAGWRQVEASQPTAITDPLARVAVASGPVRRVRSACHVGAYAVPASAAMVVVLEWQHLALPATDAVRAAHASVEDLHLGRGNLECFPGRGGAVTLNEGGRALAAYVMLGERAGEEKLSEALAVVRSLRATERKQRSGGLYDAPTDVALAGGQVWLSSMATARTADGRGLRPVHQLERFDPATFARTAGPVRLEAAWGLEAGPQKLWVIGHGRLAMVDPAAARVTAHVKGLHWALAGLAVDGRVGWAIESQVNRLRRIDVQSGRLVGSWRRPGRQAMLALALGEGALWITSYGPRRPRPGVSPTPRGPGTLHRLDPSTGRIDGRLSVGRAPGAVAVGFGSVWVMNGQDGTLLRIDPDRMRIVSSIRVAPPEGPGAPSLDLAVGPDRVWIVDSAGDRPGLTAVDPATNRVDGRPTPSGDGSAVAVAAGPEGVFVALGGDERGRLCRVQPETGRLDPCVR